MKKNKKPKKVYAIIQQQQHADMRGVFVDASIVSMSTDRHAIESEMFKMFMDIRKDKRCGGLDVEIISYQNGDDISFIAPKSFTMRLHDNGEDCYYVMVQYCEYTK